MTDGVDWLRTPGAQRPAIIPVTPPDEVGGFRFARVDDGVGPDGTPRLFTDRDRILDPAERERLLGFLGGGSLVLATDWYADDLIDPTRQFAIQNAYRTDGVWVWNAAVDYYLRHHHVAPEPELRRWIAQRGYRADPVADDVVARARTATDERLRILGERVAAYEAAQREAAERDAPPHPDRTSLPPDVRRRLEKMGWRPGRDVSEQVSRWLADWVDDLADLPFERDGYPRYEPIPAALVVLNEFGGLVSRANGPGITSAQIPFTIYPAGHGDDLMQFATEVQMLGERLEERVFQVGDVERNMGALVVDEQGRVFASGPVDLYLGQDIHEALTRMLQGIRAADLSEIGL
jgi:hypothetical protein